MVLHPAIVAQRPFHPLQSPNSHFSGILCGLSWPPPNR
jgi:hypothetical protein